MYESANITDISPIVQRLSRRKALASLGAIGLPISLHSNTHAVSSEELWSNTGRKALAQNLWSDREAYDAVHHLMIPMLVAYETSDTLQMQLDFDGFFGRLLLNWETDGVQIKSNTHGTQFLWWVSRYLRTKYQFGELSSENRRLASILVQEHFIRFEQTPAPHWSEPEFGSFRESIEWKLSNPDTEYDFYTVLHDQDMFLMSIAADLLQLEELISLPSSISDAYDLGLRGLRERSEWGEDGGWRFQFGARWDHRDHAYAGHMEPVKDMEPSPVPGLGPDTSHSHRQPMILESFDPGDRDPELSAEILAMKKGLAIQFVDNALVWPDEGFDGIRTTNYLDGHNGIYRWGYDTQGENNGYMPYELSATYLFGWWSRLGSDEVRRSYSVMAEAFPLSEPEIDVYVGPNTTRERNPLFRLPNVLTNGMKEFCVRCAAGLVGPR